MIQTKDKAFEYLSRELRGRLTGELFNYLDQEGYVEEVTMGAMEPERLVEQAKRVLKAGKPATLKATPIHPVRGMRGLKLWTVSTLLAKQAASEPAVQEFRSVHLAGGLVGPRDIRIWMESQSEHDGGSAYWYQIPFVRDEDGDFVAAMPEGVSVVGNSLTSGMAPGKYGVDWSFRTVEYVTEAGGIQILPRSGVLTQLRHVVSGLIERYPWTEAQTTSFVLTGHIPVVSRSLEAHVVIDTNQPLAGRIEMSIDPITMPIDVLNAYKGLRSKMTGKRNTRSLRMKDWRLALFGAEVSSDLTWEQKRLYWNAEYPAERYKGYQYTSRFNFWRDVTSATDRIGKMGYADVETAASGHEMLPPVYTGDGIH